MSDAKDSSENFLDDDQCLAEDNSDKIEVDSKPDYNLDEDEETGAIKLQGVLYWELMYREQKMITEEKNVALARLVLRKYTDDTKRQLADLQTQISNQTKVLQDAFRTNSSALTAATSEYKNVVQDIEEITGIKMSDFSIDDDRTLHELPKSNQGTSAENVEEAAKLEKSSED
jgi:uncharacterized membrane-anchored protein YhcB (DUF1043 family)